MNEELKNKMNQRRQKHIDDWCKKQVFGFPNHLTLQMGQDFEAGFIAAVEGMEKMQQELIQYHKMASSGVWVESEKYSNLIKELDRLTEVKKVLSESLPTLRCTQSCSSNLNVYLKCDCSINKIKKALKRADEIGKGKDGKA